MERAIVIGCPGGGKSTFARSLAEKTGLPLYYLDMMYWNADKRQAEREAFRLSVAELTAQARWIIDGNYFSTMEARMEKCDTVFFLDYPSEVCLCGVEARMGKPRPDMPWVEQEVDADFRDWILEFPKERLPQIEAVIERYRAEKSIIVFKTREEAAAFLNDISN